MPCVTVWRRIARWRIQLGSTSLLISRLRLNQIKRWNVPKKFSYYLKCLPWSFERSDFRRWKTSLVWTLPLSDIPRKHQDRDLSCPKYIGKRWYWPCDNYKIYLSDLPDHLCTICRPRRTWEQSNTKDSRPALPRTRRIPTVHLHNCIEKVTATVVKTARPPDWSLPDSPAFFLS